MQFAARNMFPKVPSLNDMMVARIAPDAFLSLLGHMITNDIMSGDPSKPINTTESLARNYTRLTIGLEGEGRIDYAKLLGAARETKKDESLIKGL
jgi:hypothetical protein